MGTKSLSFGQNFPIDKTYVITQVSCHKATKIMELFVGVHRFRVHPVKFPEGNPIYQGEPFSLRGAQPSWVAFLSLTLLVGLCALVAE